MLTFSSLLEVALVWLQDLNILPFYVLVRGWSKSYSIWSYRKYQYIPWWNRNINYAPVCCAGVWCVVLKETGRARQTDEDRRGRPDGRTDGRGCVWLGRRRLIAHMSSRPALSGSVSAAASSEIAYAMINDYDAWFSCYCFSLFTCVTLCVRVNPHHISHLYLFSRNCRYQS